VLATLAADPALGQAEPARRTLVSPRSIGELIVTFHRAQHGLTRPQIRAPDSGCR